MFTEYLVKPSGARSQFVLLDSESKRIKDLTTKAVKLIKEIDDNYKGLMNYVFTEEKEWTRWKDNGCKTFELPEARKETETRMSVTYFQPATPEHNSNGNGNGKNGDHPDTDTGSHEAVLDGLAENVNFERENPEEIDDEFK
jgi:hypothetical protein